MGTTLTLDFLEHIKRKEGRIMHRHITELRHPQWGSIVGYEADVRVAVLEDELWERSVTRASVELYDMGERNGGRPACEGAKTP